MNKKMLVSIVLIAIVAVAGYMIYQMISSRSLSPLQKVSYNYNGLDLKVVYCSPSKRGRVIFGDAQAGALIPYGTYWRLGANSATEITLSKDVKIGDKDLKAGSYRMYAIPGQASWQIAFNSELGKWGFDEPNHDLDVLKVDAPASKSDMPVEQFKISFSNDSVNLSMNLDWENTHVSVPITSK
jgi:hypothetical protein